MSYKLEYTIGIIGMGLIGGSLAKRLNEKPEYKILGFSNNINTQQEAVFQCHSITDQIQYIKDCNIIFICTPLSEILNTLQLIKPYIQDNALITDVGSVKQCICEQAELLLQDHSSTFIGGHPMAGTEHSGFGESFAELFQDKPWVLTQSSDRSHILSSIIQNTGANLVYTTAQEHDKAVSLISHLPIVISEALYNCLDNNSLADQLKSSGWASMTRLATGNQQLNHDLVKYNIQNIHIDYEEFLYNTQNILNKYNPC